MAEDLEPKAWWHRILRFGGVFVDEDAGPRLRLGMLGSVAGLVWLYGLTGFPLLLLLFPVAPMALAIAFARPWNGLPRGSASHVGWTLGHPWVEIRGKRHFARPEAVSEALGEGYTGMEPVPAPVADHAGFQLDVERVAPHLPRAEWVGALTRDALIRGLFISFLVAAWVPTLANRVADLFANPSPEFALLAPILFQDLFLTTLGAVVGTLCAIVIFSVEIALLQQLYSWFVQQWSVAKGPTGVALRGRVLVVEPPDGPEQRFHLDEPGRLVTLVTENEDGVLTLRNDRERIEIRGRLGQLAWLRDVLEARPVDEAGRDAVPASLAAMTRRRAERG
jgi:hypothetical protein